MYRVLVCVSGGGTNLQAILDRVADGTLAGVEIAGVLSNNPGAYALERAKKANVPTVCVSRKDYPSGADFDKALLETVNGFHPDLIVLAGFMVVIPPAFVRAYAGRILNIHPSLIPSFCGTGCYGLHVHEQALARGVKVTGATVHFVDEGTDTGPILLQKAVPVEQGDTPEILQRRVMEQAEWKLLPEAIGLMAAGRVELKDGKVIIKE